MPSSIQIQNSEWKKKGWSIPDLRGGKQKWFPLIVELVRLIEAGSANDLSERPALHAVSDAYPWHTYAPLLRGLGLVSNHSGCLALTENGAKFCKTLEKHDLALLFHDKYRLFGEILALIETNPKTVEEVDKELCKEYNLDWINLSNTRRRMDWLETLDLIQCVGNRKWGLTEAGRSFLNEVIIILPDAIDSVLVDPEDIAIMPAPAEIQELLQALKDNPSLHKKRNTYNIWVPSPNRIENLRIIVQFSLERVTRTELFSFIQEEFNLKVSSVESMMPFLKADGLLEEVGRNVYVATSAAKAWCESGNDIDFIRILHAHKRFVGELLAFTRIVSVRNDIYAQAKKYGLNADKARWIIGFLLEAGLVEGTQYLHVKTTPSGLKLLDELPLSEATPEDEVTSDKHKDNEEKSSRNDTRVSEDDALFDNLRTAARDPSAASKAPGVAFEEAIAAVFRYLGFDAKRIGGAGDTDVVIRWKDAEGKAIVAIVDGKSKSSGVVAHSDISDVAIETHKEKNHADYVAILGPGFSGDTIKNHARKKGFALITDLELIDIAKNSKALGLSLTEISLLFNVPNGLSQLDELISTRRREMDIITLVVSTFKQEQEAMDSLSARDLYFLLRRTSISPSLEELLCAFETLSKDEIGVLRQVKQSSSLENITYSISEEIKSVNRLRALASAIEHGLS